MMSSESSQVKHDLLAAAEAAVAPRSPTAGHPAIRPHGPNSRLVTSGLILLALLATYLFGLRPAWVFPPEPVAESPEVSEASMRLALVRERQRVELHLREHGQLPASLSEAGGRLPGAVLVAGPDSEFLVSVTVGEKLLELRSTDSLEVFLGNSLQVILSRSTDP